GGIGVGSTSTAMLTGCTISNNQSPSDSTFSHGGGLLIVGEATLTDCVVTGNMAAFQGGGIFVDGGHLTVHHTRVGGPTPAEANHANGSGNPGGGIYRNTGTVTLTDGSFVCGNVPDQCVGFTDSDHCLTVCPPEAG